MGLLAIIGGTGLNSLNFLQATNREDVETPYGFPSAQLVSGTLNEIDVCFLPRHGDGHYIPPHGINYRANLWALKESGVTHVLAIAAVGGIRKDMGPGTLVIPDQIIDYTWGRKHTYFDDGLTEVTHIDFGHPYSDSLRQILHTTFVENTIEHVDEGTYGATQGPRLETAAEIKRMARDGSDLVGMTGMPEAALARELGLEYTCCAIVANWAAGLSEGEISMEEIERNMEQGMGFVSKVLPGLVIAVADL